MKEWKGETMDKTEVYNHVLIQHGDYNNRLYILKFPKNGDRDLVKLLTQKAIGNGYSKIIGKIPKSKLMVFLKAGYKIETTIPLFFNGTEDCCFVSKFINLKRAVYDPKPLNEFNKVLKNYSYKNEQEVQNDFTIRELTPSDTQLMAELYGQVFETYPNPISDADYLKETMKKNVTFFGAFKDDKLMSISSSEMDIEKQNAEMTDFATLPEARGCGLSKLLLKAMEVKMRSLNIKTLYTIARLKSIPMNKTFLGAGYNYAGTLINNTNISGGIESMNILYKYI